jgi:hypothetical protein
MCVFPDALESPALVSGRAGQTRAWTWSGPRAFRLLPLMKIMSLASDFGGFGGFESYQSRQSPTFRFPDDHSDIGRIQTCHGKSGKRQWRRDKKDTWTSYIGIPLTLTPNTFFLLLSPFHRPATRAPVPCSLSSFHSHFPRSLPTNIDGSCRLIQQAAIELRHILYKSNTKPLTMAWPGTCF